MNEVKMDEVKAALSRMNESYWNQVAARCSELNEQAAVLTKEVMESFSKLTATQFSILQARYDGYKQLTENKKKTAQAVIISENKNRIDELKKERSEAFTRLSMMLTDLQSTIEEVNKLTGMPQTKDGANN